MQTAGIGQLKLSYQPVDQARADALIVPMGPGQTAPPEPVAALLEAGGGPVGAFLGSGDWKGDAGDVAVIYGASARYPRILFVGTGDAEGMNRERLRLVVASAARKARDLNLHSAHLLFPLSGQGASTALEVELAAEAALLGAYQFPGQRTTELEKFKTLGELTLVVPHGEAHEAALERGKTRGQAVNLARDLGNTPSNHMTPTHLAEVALGIAKANDLKSTVLDRSACEAAGLGSFLSVARGSEEPPKFILLEYNCGKKGAPTIALVGKGITFDSGGISIKPAAAMHEMKFDMCGAAAVLASMGALRPLGLGVNVIAAVPATENLPSGRATKPGDVVKSYSGKTIEVQNTDAEGRLVLADGLAYVAKNYNPDAIIDLATLTGAVVIALGHYGAAVLANDDALAERIRAASESSGDRSWRLPLWEEYPDHLKSDCADLKNIADGNAGGGTIAGGTFLAAFVEKRPWAHIDIAGAAWWDKDRPHLPKGPTGYGVRLLLDLLASYER